MVEKIKTETSEEKEAAAKYLQKELNFRLKSLPIFCPPVFLSVCMPSH